MTAANGKPIKRNQLRARRRTGAKLRIGFSRTDPRTGKIIKPQRSQSDGRS
jgi:hypothetical protein